jgi:hypothetical protein
MKKQPSEAINSNKVKKGYNEKNPGQSQGAFPPASDHQSKKDNNRSNTVDKKAKEDSQ